MTVRAEGDEFSSETFSSRAYNETYFSEIMADEQFIVDWLVDRGTAHIRRLISRTGFARVPVVLDVGCGPTVHHLFPLSPLVDNFILADYMAENLDEIDLWRRRDDLAHDWNMFARATLAAERGRRHRTVASSRASTAREREEHVRQRIAALRLVDLHLTDPLLPSAHDVVPGEDAELTRDTFLVVTSFFCADSATASRSTFRMMLRNLGSLIEDGGLLLAAFLGGCDRYKVGARWLPSPNLREDDISRGLTEAGLNIKELRRFETPQLAVDGFDHIYVAAAIRSSAKPA
jgi:NNMT/PNMT/TEMT family